MADLGAFLQGFTGMMQAQQDRELKRNELELNKKLLDAKIKAEDIETKLKQQKADMIMKMILGGGSTIPGASPMPGIQAAPAGLSLPSLIARGTMPEMTPQTVSAPVATATAPTPAPATGGLDINNLFSPTNVGRGVFKEFFGIDPQENVRWQQVDYIDPKTGTLGKVEKEMNSNRIRPETFVPNPESAKTTFTQESDLRDKFTTASKNFIDVRNAYSTIKTAATNPSAAGDMSLIYSYMKMLDPGSTVREGEFANAQNAGGVPDKIQAQYNKIVNGERLSDKQRADFISQASSLYGSAESIQRQLEGSYQDLAKQYKVDPGRVIVNYKLKADLTRPPKLGKKKKPLSAFNEVQGE